MISKPNKTIHELFLEGTPIDRALRQGVVNAIRLHKKLGNTVVVWRDGKVVHIPADQIQVPDDPPESQTDR